MLLLLNPAESALALNKTAGAARAETLELWLSVSWLITILGPTHFLSSSSFSLAAPQNTMCPLCLLTTFLVILLQKQLILIVENLENISKKKITDNCHSVIATVHILSKSLSGLLNIYIIMHTF